MNVQYLILSQNCWIRRFNKITAILGVRRSAFYPPVRKQGLHFSVRKIPIGWVVLVRRGPILKICTASFVIDAYNILLMWVQPSSLQSKQRALKMSLTRTATGLSI